MKSLKISLLVFACMLCSKAFSQKISIDSGINAQQLIENHLIQGCVETSNIESPVNGSVNGFSSFGYFEKAGSSFPFKNGIVLSTGNAKSGGNKDIKSHLNEGDPDWANDLDLEKALGINNTLNATAIEFDFSSISNQVQFNYILASEEYYSYYPCEISDGFAFLIKEAGTDDPYVNIALIPGTSTPVNTNNIHNGISGYCNASNSDYFEGYNLGDTNYNGRTKVMTAIANIQPNVTYHIKLVIADYKDSGFDSAVFIEGNSFTPKVNLGDDITTCADELTLDADIENPSAIYAWYMNNELISGETNSQLRVLQSGIYTVKIQLPISSQSCTIEDSIEIKLSSTQTPEPISDFQVCDDLSGDGVAFFDLNLKTPDVLKSVPKSSYKVSYFWTDSDAQENKNEIIAPVQNSLTAPSVIYVRMEDTINGCLAFSSFNLVVNPLPNIPATIELISCADETTNGLTTVNLSDKNDEITSGDASLMLTYHHTQADADAGINPIQSPYHNKSREEILYVRAQNSITGCSATSTLTLRVLNKPEINKEPHYIDACDVDHDGFAIFDLTSTNNEILEGLTGVSTTFHLTNDDALAGTNAIPNPTNYTNLNQNVQTVYIRVTNDVSGCASVTPIEIHSNLLLTGTRIQDFSVCELKDGKTPSFDLNYIELVIVNKLPDVSIIFYETLEDQTAQQNAIDKAVPYKPSQFPKTLYITINSDTCSEIAEIKLTMSPAVDFPSLGSVTYCDTDQDLITMIDLNSFSDKVTNGESGYTVRYYANEHDAMEDVNPLPKNYKNKATTITVYSRTINKATSCSDVKSFQITIIPAPESKPASDIVICDDDQDGFYKVNLENKIDEIVPDTAERFVTFHTSLANAEAGKDPIKDTQNFNAKTQTVYARIQNTSTGNGCHVVEPIKIIVNTQPIIPQIVNYKFCEDDGKGIGEFVFKTKDAEILKGQNGKNVSYYLTAEDALLAVNPIDKTKKFKNTTAYQTIHIRVENNTDKECFATGSFFIEVGTNPKFNAPKDWFECDDISNDGKGIFDFSFIVDEMSKGINENLKITFYASQGHAEKAINALPMTYENIKSPQRIYARIENGSICAPVTFFHIGMTKAPEANPSKPLEVCSPIGVDTVNFDLRMAEFDILDVRQYNLEINYFVTKEDAEQGKNRIQNPGSYKNISNPQTVFVRISDTKTQCSLAIPIELIINHPPAFNPVSSVSFCANPEKSYDLSELDRLLIEKPVNTTITYYASQSDADAGKNQLNKEYTYKTSSDVVYVRMENNMTNCYSTHHVTLKVDPLPIAHTPNNLSNCDDDFDGFYIFDISKQTKKVLKGQDPEKINVSYHSNEADAHSGTNALSGKYASTDSQIIFVRVTNNATGCYALTQFKTLVRPRPVVTIPDQVICEREGSIIVSADTHHKSDTYLWSTNATTPEIEIGIEALGSYWVTVTSAYGCETTQEFNVIESESATIEFTETVDFSDPNNITVTISGIGNYMYVLDDNLPQDSNVFERVSLGLHLITVIDLNGCAEVTKEVVIIDTPKFMTPNQDGYFDTWHISGVETLPGTVVYIYDRYGKQLARLTSTSPGWNGTHNGHNMPASDYWFVADIKKDNTSFQLKGHFALKR